MRVGIIGLGKAGIVHAAAVQKSGVATIAGIADIDESLEQRASDLGATLYSDYRDMLDSVEMDAVIVSPPHDLLYHAARASIERGKHVLVEKPMGVSSEEGHALVEAARAADVRLMVNFAHRFRAEYRHAWSALRAGVIGMPVVITDTIALGPSGLPRWVWSRETSGGGMMMYSGVHCIDRVAWLAGSPIQSVSAATGTFSHPVDVEDNTVAVLRFQGGGIATVVQHRTASTTSLTGWETNVFGTSGAMHLTSGKRLEIVSEKERVTQETAGDDHFLGSFREFYRAISEGRDPSPSGVDGVRALEVVLAIYESAASGRTVMVDPFDA
jgi:predicted dehydrogenase